MQVKNVLSQKEFPEDYSNELVDILKSMSFSKGKNVLVVGSMSLRSQLYASDVDCYEVVKAKSTEEIAQGFQLMMYNLLHKNNITIADLKIGSVDGFKVFSDNIKITKNKIIGFNKNKVLEKVNDLKDLKIITPKDHLYFKNKIETIGNDPKEFIELQDAIRPNVLRWKPEDIKRGYVILPNSHRVSLLEAINTNAISKLDVIAFLGDRYVEITMMYEFHINDKIINPPSKDLEASIKEDILKNLINKQYFKMSKRIFSLARLKKYNNEVLDLSKMFNSDLGRLYSVCSDIKTLLFLLENVHLISKDRIKHEIDQFKTRLSNIHTLPKWYDERPKIYKILDHLVKMKQSPNQTHIFITQLNILYEKVEEILSYYCKEWLHKINLFPVPQKYLP